MILILEDDADREAYQTRNFFNEEFFVNRDKMRAPTVWISPEAYVKDVVLADLRAKVEAVDPVEWVLAGQDAGRMLLELIDSANE